MAIELTITEYPVGARPDVTIPDEEIYKILGDEGIRKMVNDHYELLRKSPIRKMFPQDNEGFEQAKLNSSDFMIQICGGPDYFNQHRGAPKLVGRHPFSINQNGRNIWLECYKAPLLATKLPEHLILSFWNYIDTFSSWMVNTYGKVDLR